MHVSIEWRRPNSDKSHIRQWEFIEYLEYQSFGTLSNPVSYHFFLIKWYRFFVKIYMIYEY